MGDREGQRLAALRAYSVLDTEADAAIDRLAGLAGNLFSTPISLVSLIDEHRQWFKARVGLEASETPRDQAFCAHAIAMGPDAVMVVEDASLDPRFASNPLVTGAPDIRFYAGATLTTKEGHNLGTLCVIDDKPRPRPSPAELERLQLLARIVVDEFELTRAHRQAREKQRLLEIAETMSGVGHWRLDLAANKPVWSDAVYAIHGVDRESFDPQLDDAVAFYHPDDREMVRGHLASAIETGAGFEFQLRLVRADGALRHVVSRGVCELDDHGKPSAIMGLFQDITETVETIATLQRRKQRYRLVTEHAGDVITRYDFAGSGQFISPAIEKLLGYTVEETAGLTVPSVLHPDDRPHVMAVFAAMSQGLDQSTLQHRSRHKAGHYIWVESNLQLVRDESGAPQEIVSVSRDISDRKALEAAMELARAEAEAAAAVKAEFLSNMSHELRTPLTAVLGFSRLIENQPELSPATRRFVDRVSNAGKALLATVNDILDFSKLEAGQVEIVVAPSNPRQVLEDAMDLFSGQAQEKGLDLVMTGLDQLPAGLALAPDRIRQILLNLIGNAVKFTDSGRVELNAKWTARTRRLRVSITDSGAGIPADRLDQLFKRFSQVDGSSTRRHGGTGLGLAICKGLVDAMGGQIGVSSQPGQGSCFWFEIPADKTSRAATEVDGETAFIPEGCRVLVVDDNPVNRDLVCAVLRAFGAEMAEAPDGETAVQLAAGEPFDVILMDLRMPGMGGEAATRQIRQDGLNGNVPIIAFSADVGGVLPVGVFDGVVAKPLDARMLIAEINRTLSFEGDIENAA